jgi:tight adherence protein C
MWQVYTSSILFAAAVYIASFLVLRNLLSKVARWEAPRLSIAWLLSYVDLLPVPASFRQLVITPRFSRMLTTAGLPFTWSADRFARLALVVFILVVALCGILFIVAKVTLGLFLCVLLVLLVAIYWPRLVVQNRSNSRKLRALQEFSFILDLLRVQVFAGLNLEQATAVIAERKTDLWGSEFKRVVFRTQYGQGLEIALQSFGNRFASDDIRRFVMAIQQAKVVGASIGDTLRIQSESLRTRRRQRAEEKARLASVKIALPLVFLIFPALLIIYLAPAVLQIIQLQ